jgi:hypothetical protein
LIFMAEMKLPKPKIRRCGNELKANSQ